MLKDVFYAFKRVESATAPSTVNALKCQLSKNCLYLLCIQPVANGAGISQRTIP